MLLTNKNPLKILILCSYFNRPILVRNTLQSILRANEFHSSWELAFGDDGSPIPGRPIVEEILKDHLDKVTFVRNEMSFEDKIRQGLVLGRLANEVMRKSTADVGIMLCDDDELVPTYLRDLSNFFNQNPEIRYCYSKIYIFNPLLQQSDNVKNSKGKYNRFTGPVNPVNNLDASEVAWRLDCGRKYGAWFKETTRAVEGKPWTKDTDKGFFENLYAKCGLCHPTGFFGQYKGVHDYQLLWHKNVPAASLWAYDRMCRELGGKVF